MACSDPDDHCVESAWPFTIKLLFFSRFSSSQWVLTPETKLTANTYVPLRGTVNIPELESYPLPSFVIITSNLTTLLDVNYVSLRVNVAKNADFESFLQKCIKLSFKDWNFHHILSYTKKIKLFQLDETGQKCVHYKFPKKAAVAELTAKSWNVRINCLELLVLSATGRKTLAFTLNRSSSCKYYQLHDVLSLSIQCIFHRQCITVRKISIFSYSMSDKTFVRVKNICMYDVLFIK